MKINKNRINIGDTFVTNGGHRFICNDRGLGVIRTMVNGHLVEFEENECTKSNVCAAS